MAEPRAPRRLVVAGTPNQAQPFLDAVNSARAARSVAKLSTKTRLTTHASTWARAVAAGTCGVRPDGVAKTCHGDLSPLTSASWSSVLELVGSGTPRSTVRSIIREFSNSRTHAAVMLNPRARYVGVGVAYSGPAVFVVLTFAVPAPGSPTTKAPVPSTTSPTTKVPSTTPPTTKAPVPPTTNPPAVVSKVKLTVQEVIRVAYGAGFRTEAALLAVTAIAISESSLVVQARSWHPEYGYRPAAAVIGVAGPASAWNADHTRQLNSDRGLWQISSRWWPDVIDAQADNPATAAAQVWRISSNGRDYSPWDSHASGYAQSHYDRSVDGWPAIRPAVQAFLRSV